MRGTTWLLAGLALLAAAPVVGAAIVTNPYWEVASPAPGDSGYSASTVGRWAGRTGASYGTPAENLQSIIFSWPGPSTLSYTSVRSYDSTNVYNNQGAPTGTAGVSGLDINAFPVTVTVDATGITDVWTVAAGVDNFNVTQRVSVGGTSAAQSFIHYEIGACNLGATTAHVGFRWWSDLMAGTDGGGSQKAWVTAGPVVGVFDNVMETKNNPTEWGYEFRNGGALTFYGTINGPASPWLPAPPVAPDRIQYWDYGTSSNSWDMPGAAGGMAGDGDVVYFWGYNTPIALAPVGSPGACYRAHTYFMPLANAVGPTAAFTSTAGTTCQDSLVRFTDASTAGDSAIATWAWTFGDGSSGSGPNPTKLYGAAGTYTVKLTVTDANGLTSTKTVSVTSFGDPNCCPTMLPVSSVLVREGDYVRIPLSASDYENDPLTYTMAATAAPLPPRATLDPTGVLIWRTVQGDAGQYDVTFTASDAGCSVSIATRITIDPTTPGTLPTDSDNDGVQDSADNCASMANRDQADQDGDGVGDACDPAPAVADRDHDGVPDADDVCPYVPDPAQADRDGDHVGDACDRDGAGASDADRDGVPDASDVCPTVADAAQRDQDGDHVGDVCDADVDGDGMLQQATAGAILDNCPTVGNAGQEDTDGDGAGDACDPTPGRAACHGCVPDATGGPGSAELTASSDRTVATVGWALLGLAAAGVPVALGVAVVLRRSRSQRPGR